VNLADNKAEVTEGHKVLGFKDGAVEVESSRYPFCFYGDGKSTNSTRSVIGFFPFNDELNRLTLVVKDAHGGAFKVTWASADGKETSKQFSGDQLAKGVNLAAEFLDNP